MNRARHRNGRQGYAALFAILLITAMLTVSLVNANLANWQVAKNLLDHIDREHDQNINEFCQKVWMTAVCD